MMLRIVEGFYSVAAIVPVGSTIHDHSQRACFSLTNEFERLYLAHMSAEKKRMVAGSRKGNSVALSLTPSVSDYKNFVETTVKALNLPESRKSKCKPSGRVLSLARMAS